MGLMAIVVVVAGLSIWLSRDHLASQVTRTDSDIAVSPILKPEFIPKSVDFELARGHDPTLLKLAGHGTRTERDRKFC